MNKHFASCFMLALFVPLLIVVCYGCWLVERQVNYRFGYEVRVRAEVSRQVAPLEARVRRLEGKK